MSAEAATAVRAGAGLGAAARSGRAGVAATVVGGRRGVVSGSATAVGAGAGLGVRSGVGSRSQVKDHGLGTVRRCVPDLTPHTLSP